MKSKVQIKIVLDDGGSAAICVWRDKYAHQYSFMTQLAEDIINLQNNATCYDWDGNDWGTGVSNGDQWCREYIGTPRQIIKQIISDYKGDNIYGANHEELARALINRLED